MAAVSISCYLCQRKDSWTSVTAYNANFILSFLSYDGEGPGTRGTRISNSKFIEIGTVGKLKMSRYSTQSNPTRRCL